MRLILHIGSPKTGTTAIQDALYHDRERLLRRGILYPVTGLIGGDGAGHRHKKLTHRHHENDERWTKLRAEIAVSSAHTTVISCEGFWKYPDRAAALKRRFRRYDVAVVAGLRRQDRFLASWHLQHVRDGQGTDAQALLAEREPSFHYLTLLEQWASAFGAAVRPFLYPEGGDVLPVFWRVCDLPSALLPAGERLNTTPCEWTPRSVLGDLADQIVSRFASENRGLGERFGLPPF